MLTDLVGKKLLILGSSSQISQITVRAKEMGIKTVVVDKYPYEKCPGKQIADEHYDIDFSNYIAMSELIKERHIDGVLTGFTDSYLEHYYQICKDNNLPCYCELSALRIGTDKTAFKNACIESGVPVIPGGSAKSLTEAYKLAEDVGFPVIIKPVDNSGSRGVIKCENRDKFEYSYQYACTFSPSKTVIVERFMDCDSIAISYFAAESDIRICAINDRGLYVSPESGSSITSYSEYPSPYLKRYLSEVNETVIEMLKKNGFNNGMIALQAFVDDDSFYFCEMCYRPSGGHHFLLIKDQNGNDQLELLIRFALTGTCREQWNVENETPFFKEACAMLKVIGDPGKIIENIAGIDEICKRDDVISAYASHHHGDQVGASGTTAQSIVTIWHKAEDTEKLRNSAKEILQMLSVQYTDGTGKAWISIPNGIYYRF